MLAGDLVKWFGFAAASVHGYGQSDNDVLEGKRAKLEYFTTVRLPANLSGSPRGYPRSTLGYPRVSSR